MYSDGFHRSFCDDDDDLEIIQESDSIFAFETPELFRPDQIRSKRGGTATLLVRGAYCRVVFCCCCFMEIMYSLTAFDHETGSPHANLNQNNLKYGTDNNRLSPQIQEPATPPLSPNKNTGPEEKVVLLVCNRACAGQQGRRYVARERPRF